MTAEQRERIEQIYVEMYDQLMTFGRSSLKSEALAEEAIQETFRIACTKPDDFLTSPNPKGWIVIALKNTIRNIKRARANAQRLLISYAEVQGKVEAFSEDKVSLETSYGNVAHLEEFKLLNEMAVEGKSHLEMAKARGISVAACKKRVQRAKEKLREKI